MDIREYQNKALKRLNPLIANKDRESMNYACMGIIEETGEIIAELRKPLYKGNFHEKKLDKIEIMKECGDLIWYLSLVCYNNGIEIGEIEEKEDFTENNSYKKNDREVIIKKSIEMGINSSEIVREYLYVYANERNTDKLKCMILKQFYNIKELLNNLEIEFDDSLLANLNKITNRYDETGKSNAKMEEYEK